MTTVIDRRAGFIIVANSDSAQGRSVFDYNHDSHLRKTVRFGTVEERVGMRGEIGAQVS